MALSAAPADEMSKRAAFFFCFCCGCFVVFFFFFSGRGSLNLRSSASALPNAWRFLQVTAALEIQPGQLFSKLEHVTQ